MSDKDDLELLETQLCAGDIHPFSTKEWSSDEKAEALRSVEAIGNKIFPEICNVLENELGVKFTERQWDLLVGDIVISTAHIVFVAQEDSSKATSFGPRALKLKVGFDKSDYDKLIESSEFWVVFQRLINFMNGKSEIPLDSFDIETYYSSSQGKFRKIFREIIYNWINKISGVKKDKIGLVVGQYWKCNLFDEIINIWTLRKHCWFSCFLLDARDLRERCSLDVNRRIKIANSCLKEQTVEGLYKAVFFITLPVLLLESFDRMRREGDLFQSINKEPRFIYTANAVRSSLLFKYIAASYIEQSVPLVIHQHGGSYGLDRDFVFEKYEKRIADKFYTYGWTKRHDHNCEVLPVGNVYLKEKFLDIDCLVVSGVYPKVINRLHYQPMGKQVMLMFSNLVNFVNRLKPATRVVIRSRRNDYGWGLSTFYQRQVSSAVVDDKNSVGSLYGRSKIVVHCYICTSFLETIAHDIPTVGLISEGLIFDDEAQRSIDALERCGVLHRDPLLAADFVSRLLSSDSIESWWDSAETALARADFCSNYALMPKNWLEYWQYEFQQLMQRD